MSHLKTQLRVHENMWKRTLASIGPKAGRIDPLSLQGQLCTL